MGIELPCTHRSLLDKSHYQMHTSSAHKISQITVITAANRNFLVIPNWDSNLNNTMSRSSQALWPIQVIGEISERADAGLGLVSQASHQRINQ